MRISQLAISGVSVYRGVQTGCLEPVIAACSFWKDILLHRMLDRHVIADKLPIFGL
jgi:hypothetical protein